MKFAHNSYASTTAETIIDLRDLQEGVAGDVFQLCDLDVEVVGNDAEVTMTAVGPFPGSGEFAVTSGTFAIGGSKVSVSDFAIGQLVFNRTGTTAYTINIVRRIKDI